MAKRCVFCGGKPTTTEHVLSRKWIASLMPDSTSFTTRMTRIDTALQENDQRWFMSKSGKGGGGSHPVNCACQPCNNGWMQELDQTVQPALSGLALGEPGTVGMRGCELFASWATKVAILTDEIWKPSTLSADMKRVFGSAPQPQPEWTYFVALRDDTGDVSHLRAMTVSRTPNAKNIEGLVFTFRVLHLIVQVLAPLAPLVLAHGRGGSPYVHRIWPRKDPLRWPPPEKTWVKSDETMNRLEKAVQARAKPSGAHVSTPAEL